MGRESVSTSRESRINELSQAEEKAFELLKSEYKEAAINLKDFEKVAGYGKERVQKDAERVMRKKKEIEQMGTEPTRRAKLLEMMLVDQIELSDWFGQNTYTIIPSEYDDLFHGVDLALEIEDEEGIKHLALGIDVTSSPISIRKKLKIIKDHIKDGTLTAMEYFHSEDHNPDFYGTMSNIPQVVIGTGSKTVRELGELWMTAHGLLKLRQKTNQPPLSPESEASQKTKTREAKGQLALHRIQLLLLEEIKMQLTVFTEFAEQNGQTQIANKFVSVLELVESILREKGVPKKEDVFANTEDPVFQSLSEAVESFEGL